MQPCARGKCPSLEVGRPGRQVHAHRVRLCGQAAELAPGAIAFEEADGSRRVTFAEFNERAERGAAALERMGVAVGERVAILCHNSTTFFEVLFACGKTGAILVPLNWRQTPAELAPILGDCGARLLLHDAATAGLA